MRFTVLRVQVSFDRGISTLGRHFWKTDSYILETDFATLPLVPGVSGLNLYMELILMRVLFCIWQSTGNGAGTLKVYLVTTKSKFSMATMPFEMPTLSYRRKVELLHLL